MKKIHVLLILISVLLFNTNIVKADEKFVDVIIPNYDVIVNGTTLDSVYYKYPSIAYKNITYIPMTSDFIQALGLTFEFSTTNGIIFDKSNDSNELNQTFSNYNNEINKAYKAAIVNMPIKINGNEIINSIEEYPLLNFRNIIYIPMTWELAIKELDFKFIWDANNKFNIITKEYDNWTYYINKNDSRYSLNKVNSDGTEQIELIEENVAKFKIYDNWIYYKTLYDDNRDYEAFKIKTDGTQNQSLGKNIDVLLVKNEWIYFKQKDGGKYNLYRMKVDGSEKLKLADGNCEDMFLDGDTLYFRKDNDGYRATLYKMKLDGSGLEEIEKRVYNGRVYGFAAYNININGEWIYYFEDDPLIAGGDFYRVKKDSLEKQLLSTETIPSYCFYDNYIYYIKEEGSYNRKLYKMNLDGSQKIKVLDENIGDFQILDDWIYYSDYLDATNIYKIKLDGTHKTKLSSNIKYYNTLIYDRWNSIFVNRSFFGDKNATSNKKDNIINFPDQNFEKQIREEINKSEGDIFKNDVKYIKSLSFSSSGIKDLSGIEHLTNLQSLVIQFEEIENITPLENLINLDTLILNDTHISSIESLANLTNLRILGITGSYVTDISILEKHYNLEELYLMGSDIKDISILKNLPKLKTLKTE